MNILDENHPSESVKVEKFVHRYHTNFLDHGDAGSKERQAIQREALMTLPRGEFGQFFQRVTALRQTSALQKLEEDYLKRLEAKVLEEDKQR